MNDKLNTYLKGFLASGHVFSDTMFGTIKFLVANNSVAIHFCVTTCIRKISFA